MLLIRGGRVIDPVSGVDEIRDVYIARGEIVGEHDSPVVSVIDATGLVVAPGLIDMHVHFRDPGHTYKEDIYSGAHAAAAGGFSVVASMPNTDPVIDNIDRVETFVRRASSALVNVVTYGAVTVGEKGKELTDFIALCDAGAIALSDDGMPIDDEEVMRHALKRAKHVGMIISSHCEYSDMVKNYAVNEGKISEQLGIPGRPAEAEELMIERDVRLAKEIDGRVHIAHVSTAKSVDIIRHAKKNGVAVTAETCPQYFTLTEDAILEKGALARVNPPLRTEEDRLAIIEGLRDGTLDCIVTDHAPHSDEEKSRGLENSLSGMVGLETSLALTLTKLYHENGFSLADIINLMSTKPAHILALARGSIAIGEAADVVIFDPDEEWTVDPSKFHSRSHNTPFGGMKLKGRVKYTIVSGHIVYRGD